MQGFYYDPLHGGCLRRIDRTGSPTTYVIRGVFGSDEEAPDYTKGAWTAVVRVRPRTASEQRENVDLTVDFAGKPGKSPRYLAAVYNPASRTLRWADGNVWTRMFHHPSQLR